MSKKLLKTTILSLLLFCSSCGKNVNKSDTNIAVPPNTVNEIKDFGFTALSGNGYQSQGILAKEHDNNGKNHIVELDNILKYSLNGKNINYYSFSIQAKANLADLVLSLLKNNNSINSLKINQPNSQELVIMGQESLKSTGDKNGAAIFSQDVAQKIIQNKIVYWQDTNNPVANQVQYNFLIESSLIESFKPNTNRLQLHIKSKINQTLDDWLELVKSPIHIAVIGDSVMWGQGLKTEDKMFTKIVNKITNDKGEIVRIDNYSRSGSEFGAKDNNKGIDIDPEIADSSPTINAQFVRLLKDYKPYEGNQRVEKPIDPKRIHLLVMDGGINNVGPSTIVLGFNPNIVNKNDPKVNTLSLDPEIQAHGVDIQNSTITTQSKLNIGAIAKKVIEVLTSQDRNHKKLRVLINNAFCFNEDKNDFSDCNNNDNNVNLLLEDARKNLPNAQIDMMGYFPLISQSSTITCNQPITINDPLSQKPVTINVGTGGFLTFAAYIITLPIVGQTNALIISEAVKEAGSLFGTSIKN
ncbi:MAG: hypothetical protein H7263_18385, partial [Candidatus Sericytochromatia bacterium]|nr:hypothetical protein [Candidatus Sericytochromatia bacterium]